MGQGSAAQGMHAAGPRSHRAAVVFVDRRVGCQLTKASIQWLFLCDRANNHSWALFDSVGRAQC